MGPKRKDKPKTKKKSQISIKTWLIACFCLIFILIILCQNIFFAFLLEPIFIKRGKTLLKNGFSQIVDSYDSESGFESLNDIAIELQKKSGIKVTLVSESGQIYTSAYNNIEFEKRFGNNLDLDNDDNSDSKNNSSVNDKDGKSKITDNDSSEILKSISEMNESDFPVDPKIEIMEHDVDGNSIMLRGRFTSSEDETVYVMMHISVEGVSYTASVFSRISVIVSVFGLIITVVLSIIISKSLTKQIVEIESAAKNIAELNFDSRINESKSTKELSSLSKSVNSMSESLKNSISDLRVANEKLQKDIDYQKQNEKMQKEFIANVSHEMKTPLALMQIYSENLKNNVENIDKDYYCDVIIDEIKNLNDMVVSLLDISSIENGLSKMHFDRINISKLSTEIANSFGPVFEKFAFSQSIENDIYVSADSKYLAQVIKNYISNATQHTENGKKIEINLYKKEDNAVFEVKNEGKNISEEDINNIWDAFYKSDKARTRNPQNNVGIGLYIVKTVIEKHLGKCGVKNIESGVEFYFTIPLA